MADGRLLTPKEEPMSKYLNYKWLKANHQMIHYFGLGFVQLKLDNSTRMHFYSPELTPLVPEEEVHNHRYNFSSLVLKGEFKQELFEVVAGDTHVREQETCKADVKATGEPVPCALKQVTSHIYGEGSRYWISHEAFHRVGAETAVTLVTRSPYEKELAEVVRRKDAPKVCPFSQRVEDDKLWDIVERMLK
jgi:hypothetical protein